MAMRLTQDDLNAISGLLHNEMKGLKQDVSVLKEDVSVLKEKVSVLEEDVSILKGDVGVLKEDVSVLKEKVSALEEDVSVLKEDVSVLKEETNILKENVKVLSLDNENIIKPNIQLLLEVYKPEVERSRKNEDEIGHIKGDVTILKNVVKDHSRTLAAMGY